MKRSDLKKFIKEEIISILKEASTALVTSKGGTKPVSFTNPAELNALKTDTNVSSITTTAGQKIKEAKKYAAKKNLKISSKKGYNMNEASDFFEREPKSKDIEKGESIIAKTKKLLNFQKELKTLSKDMQDLAAEYREAEGSDKDEILRSLKVKTAAKKELEKKIEQLEKYV